MKNNVYTCKLQYTPVNSSIKVGFKGLNLYVLMYVVLFYHCLFIITSSFGAP